MRWPFPVVFVAACGFAPQPATNPDHIDAMPDTSVDAAPRYRKKITIAAGSPSQLVDFPVSIVITDPDLATRARADGSDIGMTALDGTPLARELVAFDKPTGALEAWVRLPAITDTLDIYMTYGGGPIAPTASAWSPAIYAAAWHLAETSGPWVDSAAGHTVEPTTPATTAASVTTGIVGSARSFDGVDDTSPGADPADGSLDFGLTSFTVSVWVDVAQSADPYDMVIDKGGDTALAGYCLTLGTSNWLAEIGDGPTYVAASFGTEGSLLGHWNHLTAVIDRGTNTVRAYTNGALAGMVSIAGLGSFDTAWGFAIGSTTAAYRFKGLVDEVRVVKTSLTADWIAAEYRNAMMRAAFVTFGPEQTVF